MIFPQYKFLSFLLGPQGLINIESVAHGGHRTLSCAQCQECQALLIQVGC